MAPERSTASRRDAKTAGDVLQSLKAAAKPRKYRNQPVEIDGIRFDSTREAERYAELRLAEQAGAIRNLEVHPRFPLVIHGIDTGTYVADFAYVTRGNEAMVEDVKSKVTRNLRIYQLKRRQVWALYGIVIREVM